jgi:predicted amidohydrolase
VKAEPKQWNVAICQIDVALGEPEANFETVSRVLHEAITVTEGVQKPDLIILPEMWNTGYALTELAQLADVHGERTQSLIANFAKQQQVHVIAGSVAVKLSDETFVNRSYVWNREGELISSYDKIHLFCLMDEHLHLREGSAPGLVEIDGVNVGLMICYDIRFPELARKLALSGAKVMFVPAQWPNPRLHHWRTLLQARAIENQMYVIACNRVGVSDGTSFFGHSMVIDPWGEVIHEGTEEAAVIRATLDLALVDEVRARIPIFADRRPQLY